MANFAGMGKKTVLKDLLKFGPKSIEFARTLTADDTVKKEIAADMNEVASVDIEYTVADPQPEEPENKPEAQGGQEEPLLEKHRRMTQKLQADGDSE